MTQFRTSRGNELELVLGGERELSHGKNDAISGPPSGAALTCAAAYLYTRYTRLLDTELIVMKPISSASKRC